MDSRTKSLRLHNGVELPLIGMGTSLSDSSEIQKLREALRFAIFAGYRHFDTAPVYGTESLVGGVIQEFIQNGLLQRSDFFITTKLPSYANRPDNAAKLLERSLKELQTDYIDLYLIHSPMSAVPNTSLDGPKLDKQTGLMIPDLIDLNEIWCFMEKAYKEGKVRAIGLSNFNEEQLLSVYDRAEIKPHCLETEYHIFLREHSLVSTCRRLKIQLIGYGPFGSPGRSLNKKGVPQVDCLNHEVAKELAHKYSRTPAQILLCFYTQRSVACIPKSVNAKRIQQNLHIFDFELDEEDCAKFDAIREEARLFPCTKMNHHPMYPFEK